jgi:ubiquinone/menaquinone biosynthesis C-methylase UbiE
MTEREKKRGIQPRKNAMCVHCFALERHRFSWIFLVKKTDLFDGKAKKMLHVAPESCFLSRFKEKIQDGYLTADLNSPHVMVKMDISSIQYPEGYFDVIYCSHVLEHVKNDIAAIKEFHRVLKKGGWAILMVPITAEKTIEDQTIISPELRLAKFGHPEHVRRYGIDFENRLVECGFSVETIKVDDFITTKDSIKMGLSSECGEIYYCKKNNL